MTLCLITSLVPVRGWTEEAESHKPYEQDFIITAYYSPLPDQCCYVRGGEEADKMLNGEGRAGADGTPVYPGMIAAPLSYPFGTRIVLPGIGIVTVHDRGGAIQEVDQGHRLDVWVGEGEEGLARALAFGVMHARGKVYPAGTAQPAERFALENLASPPDRLKPFLTLDYGLLDARPRLGQRGLSVTMLQEHLRDVGSFTHAVTDLFGSTTQQALTAFLRDMGSREPSDRLTERSAALLVAAVRQKQLPAPVPLMGPESSARTIATAQRLLRFLGLYRGRTDGRYSDPLQSAVIAFQRNHALVADAGSPGAGRIGPLTRGKLIVAWQRAMIEKRSAKLMLLKRISAVLAERGELPDAFLALGQTGHTVRRYQELLAQRNFFPKEKINGVFGELTRASTIEYQRAAGIIQNANDEGAGTVGPQTMRALRIDEQRVMYKMVRSYGWSVL